MELNTGPAARPPDWSRFATRQDLAEPGSRLSRWMVGSFVTFTALLGGWITVFTVQLGLLV